MTTKDIAEQVVARNRVGDYASLYTEFYTDTTVSVETWGDREEYVGVEAIIAKGKAFEASVEQMHELRVSDPLVADQSFAVTYYMDVTFKPDTSMPGRIQLTELAVYTVRDSKIIREEFQA
jgi:hypothetical protein